MSLEVEFVNYHRNTNYTLNKHVLYRNTFYKKYMKRINSVFELNTSLYNSTANITLDTLVADYGQYENIICRTMYKNGNGLNKYKTFDTVPYDDSLNKYCIDKDIVNTIITKLIINYNSNVDDNIKYYHSCIFTELSLEVNSSYHNDTFLLALVIANDLRQLDVINMDDRSFNYYLDKFVEKVSNIYTNTYTHWVYNLFNSQQIVTNMKYTLGLDNLYFAQYIGAVQKYIEQSTKCSYSPSIELIYGVNCNHSDDEFLKPFIDYGVDELITTTDSINNFRQDLVEIITKKFFDSYFNNISINNTINALMVSYLNLLTYRTYKTFCYDDEHFNINYIISNDNNRYLFDNIYNNIENFSETFSIILELVTNEFQNFSNNIVQNTQPSNTSSYHFITNSYISNMNMILDAYIFYINNIAYNYKDFDYEYYFNMIPWKKIVSIDCNIINYANYHFKTTDVEYSIQNIRSNDGEYDNNIIIRPNFSSVKSSYIPGETKSEAIIGVMTTLFNYYSMTRLETALPEHMFGIINNNLYKLSNYQKLIK